jgi:DNA-damage-inducible protein D
LLTILMNWTKITEDLLSGETAHNAGVITNEEFAIFQNAGYMGLYGGLDVEGILAAVYQSVFGGDVYLSLEEKVANLLFNEIGNSQVV